MNLRLTLSLVGNAVFEERKCFKIVAMGRVIIYLGILLVIVGLIVVVGEKAGIRLGRLPGDIIYRGKNTTFYFPLVTSILLSIVLTLVMWFFNRRS